MHTRLAPLVVVLAACTPPSPPVDAGPVVLTDLIPASSYCETIEPFFCPFYLRCGRIAAADLAACSQTFLESCEAKYEPTYVDLERAGLLTLSRDGVDACRAHLDNVECDQQLLDLDGPCGAMWIGAQPIGASCGFDVESFVCAKDAVCVLGLDFCGTCEAALPIGAPCGADVEGSCVRAATCVEGTCVERAAAGTPCDDGAPCVLGAQCADGVCTGPAHVAVGDACDQAHRCPYAARCAAGECVASAALSQDCDAAAGGCASGFCGDRDICVALLEPGDACTTGAACRTGACIEGACSDVPSHCIAP